MYSKVISAALYGIDAESIIVESDISGGLPALVIVGLPDTSVRESKDRIKSAIVNSGNRFPQGRITINLVPTNTRKEGNHLDLPMAVCILTAAGSISSQSAEKYAFIGELSLDGKINSVAGALPLVLGLCSSGNKKIILPRGNIMEASVVKGADLYPVSNLREVIQILLGKRRTNAFDLNKYIHREDDKITPNYPDFNNVHGQEQAKRALVIAAASMHNVLMSGPPGVGKSMLARCIPGILPPLTYDERLELTKIYSIAGLLKNNEGLISERPFRSPHHSITSVALIGGGKRPKPGEISLAHFGVLFLDEIPEFKQSIIESLRQPMEDEQIEISRTAGRVVFPSKFLLVAASNPCKCGYYGDESHNCTCTVQEIHKYRSKISGPISDRIDILVNVRQISFEEAGLAGNRQSGKIVSGNLSGIDILKNDVRENENNHLNHIQCMSTAEMRKSVMIARQMQLDRYINEKINYNSQLTPELMQKYCTLDDKTTSLLNLVYDKMHLSLRSCHRIIKLSRTIADIEGEQSIQLRHLAEAVQLKNGNTQLEENDIFR